jgi:hypothetical protein
LRDECYGDVYICDDDSGGGLQSAVIVNLMEGSQVVIEIAAFGGDAQGSGMGHADYVLNITDVD